MRESIEELIEFLQDRADRCQKSCQHVAAVGHRETIKHLENIVQEAKKEEKYVWSVQVFMSGRWIFMVTLNTGNSLEEAAKWFPTKERAEYFASLWEPDTPARVVKRRVSPVVVDG